MALNDAERTDIRRHCGYPSYGSGADGFQGWRFHQAYGLLEFRMTRMSGAEEAVARQYLATLAELERAVRSRNSRGLRFHTALFDDWRRRLCGFLGVPPGPALRGGGAVLVV